MTRLRMQLLLAVPAALAAPAAAQVPASRAACECSSIPALTPVSIEILAPLSSRTSKSGDSFPIRLAAAIVVGGRELVPAGVSGVGEVVHAKKSGGMGAAGELVLAARYVEVGGQRLTLRSLQFAVAGRSSIDAVSAVNAASAASPLPIGLIGFFVTGGQVDVPAGTVAAAKTRENFTLPGSNRPAVSQTLQQERKTQ
jgi:hypothetical protein